MLDRRRLSDDGLELEIAWHQAEIARLEAERRERDDAALLRALARAIGEAPFTSADVIEFTVIAPTLRDALGALVASPKQLGKRLARVAGRERRGLWLDRVRRGGDGCMWKIHFPCPGDDPGAE